MTHHVIFFHSNCMDGFGSLWAYNPSEDSILVPSIAGKPLILPDEINDGLPTSIVCLDISPPIDQLEKFLKDPNLLDFVVIDHHKLDLEKYKELGFRVNGSCEKQNPVLRLVWDNKKSGAILTWNERKNSTQECKIGSRSPVFATRPKVPDALLYIQDRDLWAWKMNDSKAVNEAMYNRLKPPTPKSTQKQIRDELKKFEDIVKLFEEKIGLDTLISEGNEILKRTNTVVDFLTNQAEKVVIEIGEQKYKVFLSTTRQYRSEVGSALMKRPWGKELPDFSVCYTINFPTREVWLSLRSTADKTDVSKVFRSLDEKSGGHRESAGATLSLDTFVSILRYEILRDNFQHG